MQAIHTIKDRIEALSFQIKNISKSRFDNFNEDFKKKAIDNNYRYNLSEVIANIIIKVNFVDNSITKFQKIVNDYNNRHKTTLNYNYFIDNCLIREILGDVVIPSVVIHSLVGANTLAIDTDYYNCLQGYYNDCKDLKNLITSQDLNNIIAKFGRGSLNVSLLRDELYIIEQIDGSDDFAFRIEHNYNSYLYYLSNEITTHILMQQGINSTSLKKILNANLCNFEKLKDIFLSGNLNSFCNAAVELLSSENDLNNTSNEIKKIWFDYNYHQNTAPKVPNINTNFSSIHDLISFTNESPEWITNHFLYQSLRKKYSTLLEIIICTSSYDTTEKYAYETILNLIKDLSKPYITYTIYNLIQDKYPFIAPYLLVDKETVSLGLEVIEHIQINRLIHNIEDIDRISQLKHELQIKNDIWLEMFNFVLDQLDEPLNITDASQYKHISDILINLANKVFNKITFHGGGDNSQHEYLLKRYTLAIGIISSKKFYTSPYANYTLPKIIYSLLPTLLNKASEYLEEEYKYIRHGFISLSCGSIYHAIELIKLSNTINECDKFYDELMENKQKLVATLFDKVVFFYTTTSVQVRQYRSNEVSQNAPKRHVHKVGFELIDWGYFYIELIHSNLLAKLDDSIAKSIIIYDTEKGIYEDNNQEQYHKIELYVKSLMLAYIHINENLSLFEGIIPDISHRIKEVESLIIKHSLKYSKTDLKNGSLDIFEYNYIFQSYNPYYQSPKSLLYKCVNLFDENTAHTFISNFFANSFDLGRMLDAANSIANKNIVTLIEQKIDSIDIDKYIESTNWIPEITQALIDATNSKKYWKTYAKKLFEAVNAHYEKVKTTRKLTVDKDKNDLLFEISLILAFKDNNPSDFDRIQLPECLLHENNRQNIILKEFYSILFDVYHDKNYDTAITKLKKLHTDNIDIPKFAIELFFIRTRQATDTTLNKTLLAKANSEFESYISSQKDNKNLVDELNQYDSYIKYYKLYYFIVESNSDNFDIILNELPDELKFDALLVPHVYNFYQHRELNELAMSYLDNAQQYINDNDPAEISQINKLVDISSKDPKNLKKIRLSLEKVLALPAKVIPQVVPDKINDKKQLNMFILHEFIQASKTMLDKIKSVKEVQDENKYNDLLVAILKLRFDIWGWVISDQNRGGSSGTGIDAGSIDFTIMSGSTRLALAEALIHKDTNYAQEHTLRCFKYDANLQCFFVIIYSHNANFDQAWEKHQKYVQAAQFNEKVSLLNKDTNNGFIDLSTEFNDIRGIKVAKTQNKSDVEMYHIMINLNNN
ncbi:MAG: hypothetical protein EKK57_06740 [Proteobacteria bacterium]|nr:MAG: hypothetical protein EKK57_06740 [Pseudomonadota bacterium]